MRHGVRLRTGHSDMDASRVGFTLQSALVLGVVMPIRAAIPLENRCYTLAIPMQNPLVSAAMHARRLTPSVPQGTPPAVNSMSVAPVECTLYIKSVRPLRTYVRPPPTVRFCQYVIVITL